MLKPYDTLPQEEKTKCIPLLEKFLKNHEFQLNYRPLLYLANSSPFRIEIEGNTCDYPANPEFICIRESTGFPPAPDKKKEVATILKQLSDVQLIAYEIQKIPFTAPIKAPTSSGGKIKYGYGETEVYKIKAIDLQRLTNFLNLVSYKDATSQHRETLKKELLETTLQNYGLTDYYRLLEDPRQGTINLRPSTQNPPDEKTKQTFENILSLLTEMDLISHNKEVKNFFLPQFNVNRDIEILAIDKLNQERMDFYQNTKTIEINIQEIDPDTNEPIVVKRPLHQYTFTPLTWFYIDYCMKENLEEEHKALDTGLLLDSEFRDGIVSCATAKYIPIILATDETTEKPNVYELETLLKLTPHENENGETVFKSPQTFTEFRLADIRPAPGGLRKLEEKIAATQNPEEPNPGPEPRFRP